MEQAVKTAIVILNYNGRDFLRRFLPSVIQFSQSAKIIVADNGSTDDSVAVLQNEFPGVDVLRIGENLGFCGGYNFALKKTEASYYLLLNSDVEVTKGWLDPLTSLLDQDLSIAAVHPKILSEHDRGLFEYAGAAGGYIDALGYPFCRGRIFDTVERDEGQYNDNRQVFWATGACLLVRSEVFHELGGFDEAFFAHMEEIDLCWKIHRKGMKVYYAGSSTVYHVGGGTLSKLNPRKTYYNFRNGLALMFKNMSALSLTWKLPVRVGLDWVAVVSFLLKGGFGNAWAVLKAHVHFLLWIPSMLKKRARFKYLKHGVSPAEIVYPRSIVLAYYARGKKFFGDLKITKVQ